MTDISIVVTPSSECHEFKPFIYNSWLKSYGRSIEARRMTSRTYYSNYTKVLDNILNADTFVAIANSPQDPSHIYGYVVFNWDHELDLTLVHWAYVKEIFRNLGIAKKLLSEVHPGLGDEPIVCTFSNENFDRCRQKYLLTYNPFLRP